MIKTALQLLLISLCLYGWNDFYNQWNIKRKQTPGENSHVVQLLLDQPTMLKIHQLDNQFPQQALFVLMSPDIAMEIERSRTLILPFNNMAEAENPVYNGRVKKLFLIVPISSASGKTAQTIKAVFADYKSFSEEKISNAYVLFTGL